MDPLVRAMLVTTRIEDREREAASVRLSRIARSRRHPATGSRRRRLAHDARRIAIAGAAVALALLSLRAAPAAAMMPARSVTFDPWPPLAAGVERVVSGGWVCAGLPRPDPRSAAVGETPVAGETACVGVACRWDLDDDRLDGALVPGVPDACADPSEPAPIEAAGTGRVCRGELWLADAAGRPTWIGAWSRAGERELLVVLAGTGAAQGLTFVGRWTDAGAAQGRVVGRISVGPSILLVWPAPFL